MSAIFGETLTFGQTKGPDVRLKVFGDELYARYEDLNGFTVVYDQGRGQFCYARLAAGLFVSTEVPLDRPPPAGIVRHLQKSPEAIHAKTEARRMRRSAISRSGASEEIVRTFGPNQGLLAGRVLSIGRVRGLTILVNFRDVTSTVTRDDVDAMLNSDNYTRNGNICSAREYFRRVSSGKLDYQNVVVGPFQLSREREFYINNLLIEEALQLAVASGVDLKQFDSRNQNIIDALNVLYAGQTQYRGELWPHNFNINLQFGTMHTDLYLLTSLGRTAADLSIGTFCHENGHLLCRFPDMYDYGERDGDMAASAGIGNYCLMGSGNHVDNGRSPSPVCAYLRDLAGWCDNEIDLGAPGEFDARQGDYNTVMKFRSSKANEYFLVENRSKMNLDRGGLSSGLAVYHCDILGSNELQQGTATKHYQCALLQADGERHLELNVNQGDGADLFGAVAGVALSSESRPNSREWDGREFRPGDIGHLRGWAGDQIPRRRRGCRNADDVRSGDAQSGHSGQSAGGRVEQDQHHEIGYRHGDQGERQHHAYLYRRPARDPHLSLRKARNAARPARRIGRQPGRHLQFGLPGSSRRDARTADEGRLGPQRVRPCKTGSRQAEELEDRAQECVGRLVSAERRAGSCRGLAAGGRGAPAPACRSAHAPRRQEEAQGCLKRGQAGNPYSWRGLSTRMRRCAAVSSTHCGMRSTRSPSFGTLRPSMLTCGQSVPNTSRSARCFTSARAIGVTAA